MTAQQDSIKAVVAAIDRTGRQAVVERRADGTVSVSASGSTRSAIIGKRGRIQWIGESSTRWHGVRASVVR